MNESRPRLFGMLAGLFLVTGLVLSSMLGTTSLDQTITAVVAALFC